VYEKGKTVFDKTKFSRTRCPISDKCSGLVLVGLVLERGVEGLTLTKVSSNMPAPDTVNGGPV